MAGDLELKLGDAVLGEAVSRNSRASAGLDDPRRREFVPASMSGSATTGMEGEGEVPGAGQ